MGYLDHAGLSHFWGKVKAALAAKQDKLSGAAGQVVGFGADGAPEARSAEELKGPAGKSAYQYAQDGGYTGTEAEFQALIGSGPWVKGNGSLASTDVTVPLALALDTQPGTVQDVGKVWTEATLPVVEEWRSIAYGGGKFVAVASGGFAAYSSDGINWKAVYMQFYDSWRSVTYGGGKFVAVGGGSAAYSSDGINWTEATLPSSAEWTSITYGGSKFVAVASGSDRAVYSSDGINWTEATLPSSAEWTSIAYGGGKFVAVAGSFSNSAAYSTATHLWLNVNGKLVGMDVSGMLAELEDRIAALEAK